MHPDMILNDTFLETRVMMRHELGDRKTMSKTKTRTKAIPDKYIL